MKKVLFLVGPALGHVGRSLVIARALVDSTPDVHPIFTYVSPGYGDSLLRAHEFESIQLAARDRGGKLFAETLEERLTTINPSVITLDLSPMPWLRFVRFPLVPRAYVTNFFLVVNTGLDTVQDKQFLAGREQINRTRSQRGLTALSNARDLYAADALLFCDPAVLTPVDLTPSVLHHFVGPCVWQPQGTPPTEVSKKNRLLVASLGSTGINGPSLEDVALMKSALGCGASVLVSANENIEEPPPYDYCLSQVPVSPMLKRSVLAITQGGAGSTYAALSEGVPVAIWPAHRNHEVLANLLSQKGLGILGRDLVALAAAEIGRTVGAIQEECDRLSARFGTSSGPSNAAAVLRSLI